LVFVINIYVTFSRRRCAHVCWRQVPVLLVRGDGIIYATGLTFTYTPEPGAVTPPSSNSSSSSSRLGDSVMWRAAEQLSSQRRNDSVPLWHAPSGRVSPHTHGALQPPPAHTANGGYVTATDRFIDVS